MLYSLIALLLNRFRDEKFSYPALLNISMLALTPVAVIQFLGLIDSHFRMTVHLLIAVVITVFYLVLALFIALPPDFVPGEVRRT